jgi:hypothetical protein
MSAGLAPSPDTLMVKTAKGSAEMGTREHRLGPRLRTILIMVDGNLTLAEITARAAALGNAAAIVGHLLDEGFIEPAGGSTSQPPAQFEATTPPKAQKTSRLAEPMHALEATHSLKPSGAVQPARTIQPPEPFEVTQRLKPVQAAPPAQSVQPRVPLEATQRLKPLGAAEPGGAPPDPALARTVRMPNLALENGVDEATRNLVTELTRSGNLVTLRGDAMAGMRESEATNPARFYMRETMSRLLGSGAIGVLDGIDLATNRDLVLAELERCAQIIKDLKGEEEAASFRISVLALLPG